MPPLNSEVPAAPVAAEELAWQQEAPRKRHPADTPTEVTPLPDADSPTTPEDFKAEWVWQNIVKFGVFHFLALWGIVLLPSAKVQTILFNIACWWLSCVSITAGAHRLWSHRSYKASLPLRFFLVLMNCTAMENSIYVWARDHRVHHKYSETSADPHDANRGFFFAHMGWLLVRKHPEVIKKGAKIDLSDLESDPLVMFQHRHYVPLALFFCLALPTFVPVYFWGEAAWTSYTVAVLRYLCILHCTWLVNSAAHMFGSRPYDININPSENRLVALLSVGEGFHNYHHTFPHDYSASEWRWSLNGTTLFIDAMAWLGLAWGRKTVSDRMREARISRTGPGTHKMTKQELELPREYM